MDKESSRQDHRRTNTRNNNHNNHNDNYHNTVNRSSSHNASTVDSSTDTDDVFERPTSPSQYFDYSSDDGGLRRPRRVRRTSLANRWSSLQSECEERNVRLILIHEMLHNYEKAVQPFLVSFIPFLFFVISIFISKRFNFQCVIYVLLVFIAKCYLFICWKNEIWASERSQILFF